MLPRANQVPTRKDPQTEDPKDHNQTKGLRTSPILSATDAARKATTRMNAMPGSSIMTYKDPDRAITATANSAPLRVTGTIRPPITSKSNP
jgi:hypothetical protein